MASKSSSCQKCGAAFNKMRAVNGVRTFFTLFCALFLMLGFIVFVDRISDPMLPEMQFINVNSMIAAMVVLVLINAASVQTIKEEKKKFSVNGGLYCKACQEKLKVEQQQAHLAEEAAKADWTAELGARTAGDAALRAVVQEWTMANGGEPSRSTVNDLAGAINLEKAGNFESAAKIYEGHKLWSLAGKAREKNRVQTVKHVTVDMNQLIEQIGTRGLAVPYR